MLREIIENIRSYPGLTRKRDIYRVTNILQTVTDFGDTIADFGEDAAAIASAGVIRICVQASDRIICIFKTGELPGLKSDARATGAPASMSRRAGG